MDISLIPKQGKVKIHWNVSPYDYSKEKAEQLRAIASKKYNIPKQDIVISQNVVVNDSDGIELDVTKSVVSNIQDPQFQKKLFKDYININKIDVCDFDVIDKIDNEINSKIDYQVYDKLRQYSIKWIKWSNFRSYGSDNYFDFTQLHNLVLLNGEPANQSGKTTFAVDLLHFLLFGTMKKCRTYEEIYNKFLPEATNVEVEGEIEIEGERYIIKRILSRPPLNKRTSKSHVSQKVEYYRIIGGEREELSDFIEENGEDTRSTNKIIRESIGREEDFDLIMCITGSNLDSLIEEKPTERGRIFSRWIGLLPLEKKDVLAREKFNNVIKPNLLSNKYNKEELIQEIKAYEIGIAELKKRQADLEERNKSIDEDIKCHEQNKSIHLSRKVEIDQNVLKIDISTLKANIQEKIKQGQIEKEVLEKSQKELDSYGEVNFSLSVYDDIKDKIQEAKLKHAELLRDYKELNVLIKTLKEGQICPTCHRPLDNVDNSAEIALKEAEKEKITEEGKHTKEYIDSLEKDLKDCQKLHDDLIEVNRLKALIPAIKGKIENLRNEYRDLIDIKKEYDKNSEAIDKNNEIDTAIRNIDDIIKTKRETKENNIKILTQIGMDITTYNKNIEEHKQCISELTQEEKLLMHWKIYLDMVGKNGISKMVMKKALPIINARISQLLEDVCDFDISIDINTRNEVEFFIIKKGIKSSLYSDGSGFEKTAAALALRSVLAEVSTISKSNFVIIDEVLGRTARQNFDNMRNLYERIAKNYDFIFHITHIEEVKEWHNNVVTVTKNDEDVSTIKCSNIEK